MNTQPKRDDGRSRNARALSDVTPQMYPTRMMVGHHANLNAVQTLAACIQSCDVEQPINLTLQYDVREPLAITIDVSASAVSAMWLVGRDLMAAGLHSSAGSPAGSHQIHTWVSNVGEKQRLCVELGGCRPVLMSFGARDVEEFLNATWALVPTGTEYSGWDIDAEVAQITAGQCGRTRPRQFQRLARLLRPTGRNTNRSQL